MIATRAPEYLQRWRSLGLHQGRTIDQEIAKAARDNPDLQLHFSSGSGQGRLTFAEVGREMERYASGLATLGLQAGDTVAVQAPHSVENLLFFAAAMRLGLRYVPIVSIYESAELDFILTQSEARAIAVPTQWRGADIPARIRGLRAPSLRHAIILGGGAEGRDFGRPASAFADLRGDTAVAPHEDAQAAAVVLYTSGSTGVPKGAVHSHESALAELRAAADFIAQTGHAPVLSPLPTGHVAGVVAMLRPFLFSIPAVFMDHWNASEAAQLIAEHQIGWSYGTPFHLLGLLDIIASQPLPSLKAYQIGGAGVPSALIQRASAAGISACRGYGCTEQPTITSGVPDDPLEKRANTDGRGMPGVELKLVDDSGEDAADGQPGEIVCTGPDQFLGYLDAAHNADAFDAHGWFRTGDVGIRDQDGYVAIVDRKKDIIIRAGENIASKEVEEVLMRHPTIAEAAVVGIPDAIYGERVAAVVILRQGSLDIEELKRHFRAAGVAIQKTPERLIIVDDLPRTPLGKVHKRDLRRQVAEMSE